MSSEGGDTGNSAEIQIRKILLPIDDSGSSLNAAKYAIKIAKNEGSQLICIHIIASVPHLHLSDEHRENIRKKVQAWFNVIKDLANSKGIAIVKTDILLDVNSVIGSIIDYAINENMDLIVMGTRGRTGLKRFLLGSVANGVAQHAHCPVLLVR
jgi:nucleotide-binding universal stress UspA family protein